MNEDPGFIEWVRTQECCVGQDCKGKIVAVRAGAPKATLRPAQETWAKLCVSRYVRYAVVRSAEDAVEAIARWRLYRYTKRDELLGERDVSRRKWDFRYPPDGPHVSSHWYVDDDRIEMMPDVFVGEGDGVMSRVCDLPGYVLQAIYEIEIAVQQMESSPGKTALADVPAPKPRLVINCEGDWEP